MNEITKYTSTLSNIRKPLLKQGIIRKKILLLVGVSFFVYKSPVVADDPSSPYADIFKDDIYNQSNIHFKQKHYNPKSLHNSKLNKKIVQRLFLNKIEFLENKLFKTYDRELNDLKILIEKNKPSYLVKTLKLGGEILSSATGFGLVPVLPEIAVAQLIRVIPTFIATTGITMKGMIDFLLPDGQVDLKTMKAALERKKKDLIDGLHKEPISDLEIAYVLRKRFYTSPRIKEQIEEALIMARRDGGLPLDFRTTFLKNSLNLPFCKKEINLDNSLLILDNVHNPNPLTPKEKARESLISYHEETKYELQKIIIQIACTSTSKALSYRRFYYFWGEPGLGKTTAARSIPIFVGLPYYEMSIRTVEDISQSSLEGADWQKELGTPGHIAQALLKGVQTKKNNDKGKYEDIKIPIDIASKYFLPQELSLRILKRNERNTYENSIFIINDFDRLLLDPNTSTQALAFLLEYLDPEKRSFFSPYFQASISTKSLIVIITGNNKIPEEKKFEALKDRCVEVEFKAFSDDMENETLSSVIDEMSCTYSLKKEQNNKLKNELLDFAKSIKSPAKVKSSSQSSDINSGDRDKIDSYQVRKDEHDQQRIERHIDLAKDEIEQENDSLSFYHQIEIATILDAQDDRLLAVSIGNAPNKDNIKLNNLVCKDQVSEDFCSSSRSLRNKRKEIEGKVIEKKIEEMISNPEKNNSLKIIANENSSSEDDSYEDKSQVTSLNNELDFLEESDSSDDITLYPPNFEDIKVLKKAQAMQEISTSTGLLYSDNQPDQLKGIRELLGYSNLRLNTFGQIDSFWKTKKQAWGSYSEKPDNLGAFANRLKRFEMPTHKNEIVQMHLGLVKSITEALLKFKESDPGEQGFIYKKIESDSKRKKNIKQFAKHLEILGNRPLEDKVYGESLTLTSKNLFKDYQSWLGQGEKSKPNLLLNHYHLLLPHPDIERVNDVKLSVHSNIEQAGEEDSDIRLLDFQNKEQADEQNFNII